MWGLGRCSGTREVKGHGWLGTFREEGSSNFLTLRAAHTTVCSPPRRLRPRRHAKEQDFAQCPDVIGEPRRHGRHPGLPLPG